MATVSNNFEGGTQGTGITPGNSGGTSGTAFALVAGPWTFDTTGAFFGLGGRVQISSSTAWRAYHSWTSVTQVAARIVFTFNGTVTNTFALVASINNTSFAVVFKFAVNSTGHLNCSDATGATLATSTGTLSAGTPYVLEYQIQPGNATNNGVINAQAYAAATPGTLMINFSSSTANLGTVQGIARGSLGEADTVTSCDLTFDEVVYNTGTLTAVGPPPTYANAAAAAAATVPPGSTSDAISIGMTIQGS